MVNLKESKRSRENRRDVRETSENPLIEPNKGEKSKVRRFPRKEKKGKDIGVFWKTRNETKDLSRRWKNTAEEGKKGKKKQPGRKKKEGHSRCW